MIDTALLWQNIEAGRERNFLTTIQTRVSYALFAEAVRRWIALFDESGTGPGQRLVIQTSNELAALSGFVAALLDGVVPVLLAPDTPVIRTTALVEFVQARLFVTDAFDEPPGVPPTTQTLMLAPEVRHDSAGWWKRRAGDPLPGLPVAASRAPSLPRDPDGLAYILFTSGTTASPSGVQITRRNLFSNLKTLIRVFGYNQRSRIFNDMVLAHADGLIQGPVLALAAGCAVVRSGGFQLSSLEPWLSRVRSERCTHVIAVPTIWAMIDRFAKHDDYFDATECESLLSVAAKLPDALWQRLETRFGRPVFNQYGLTETVVTALWAGPHPEMGAFGTIGCPIDCEAQVGGVAAGEPGELLLRGANIFPGYWRDPDRTCASFTEDGWFRTGDLARLRPDGSFEILGRTKSIIMSGGFLIRPDEIDEAMLRHPAIQESATIAFDDATFGEVPVTAVVLERDVDEAALTAHARANLESPKVPKRIVSLKAIPRGDAGKPQIKALHAAMMSAIDGEAVAPVEESSVEDRVVAVAAEVFRVPAANLQPTSKSGAVPGWDSFSQLNLIFAIEERFDVRVPASQVAAIKSLADIIRVVKALRG